jgi:hypothetical protein
MISTLQPLSSLREAQTIGRFNLILTFMGAPKISISFEIFWLKHPNFQEHISEWWTTYSPSSHSVMHKFQQNLKYIKQQLKLWNKEEFGNIFQAKQQIIKQMEHIQQTMIQNGRTDQLVQDEENLQTQLHERDSQEEILWKKKSRVRWLKEGEKNTKFFHRSMIQHCHHNRITKLKYANGNCLTEHKEIERELTSYFHNLLSEPQQDRRTAIQKITQHILNLVSPEQNKALMHPTSLEEVEQVVFDMPKNKSPGPDGFTTDFFQACWPIIKWDVWEVVEDSRYPWGLSATTE